MFDAHTHLDRLETRVGQAPLAAWMERWAHRGQTGGILAGVSPDAARQQAECCGRWPGYAWTLGLHPWEAHAGDPTRTLSQLSELEGWEFGRPDDPVGIGETGLDRARAERGGAGAWELQEELFVRQLKLAARVGLPLVLHNVGAHGHAQAEVRKVGGLSGMVHDFGGSLEEGLAWWRLGFFLSIRAKGTVSPRKQRALAGLPIEALLVESDLDETSTEEQIEAGLWPAITLLSDIHRLDGDQLGNAAGDRTRELFGVARPKG